MWYQVKWYAESNEHIVEACNKPNRTQPKVQKFQQPENYPNVTGGLVATLDADDSEEALELAKDLFTKWSDRNKEYGLDDTGYKDDANKEQALFPFEVWEDMHREEPISTWSALLKKRVDVYPDVEEVLQYGLEKYGKRDSWKLVEGGYRRYRAAMMRHETQEDVDDESGMTHYKHSSCNMVFLAWFQIKAKEKEVSDFWDYYLGDKK